MASKGRSQPHHVERALPALRATVSCRMGAPQIANLSGMSGSPVFSEALASPLSVGGSEQEQDLAARDEEESEEAVQCLSTWPAHGFLKPCCLYECMGAGGRLGLASTLQGAPGTSGQTLGYMKEEAVAATHALESGDPFPGEVH